MAHYAKVHNGIVTNVIVAEPEFFDTFVDETPGTWLKTSYNIRSGVYYNPETNQPAEDQSVINEDEGRKRKNFAGVGYKYDVDLNGFIPPSPFPSWVFNETTCNFDPPIPKPSDGNEYIWNEENQSWDEVPERTT